MTLATSSPGTLGVLIADSNRMQAQLLAGALRRRPEFRVVTCQMENAAILQAVTVKRPRVALLALHPSLSLAESVIILRQFHLAHRDIPKVLLVDVCDRQLIVSAFRSGVRGIFTLTDSNLRLLCKCLMCVAAGQVWANAEQLNFLMDLISEVPSLRVLSTKGASLLTPREEQVVAVVAEGLSNRQVARELNLSEHTVKKYLFRIFEKLGISSRVELVLYAMNNGDPRQAEWLAGAPTAPTSETQPAKA
jgi:DNA-binding NarL/FixJ family response regulator